MGLWSDFTSRWRKQGAGDGVTGEYIDVTPSTSGAATPVEPPTKKESWLSRLRPGSKRDRQIAWLQAGYSETLELMRTIRQHLERQEDVQHKMVAVLERVPESMESLKGITRVAEQQGEMISLLRQQTEAAAAHDRELIESMNRFNQTLGLLDETNRNSGRTVANLVEKSRESEDMLRSVIERSERRIMVVIGLFIAVVILGVGALVYFGTDGRAAARNAGPVAASISAAADTAVEAPATEAAVTVAPEKPARRGFFRRIFGHHSDGSQMKPAASPTVDDEEDEYFDEDALESSR